MNLQPLGYEPSHLPLIYPATLSFIYSTFLSICLSCNFIGIQTLKSINLLNCKVIIANIIKHIIYKLRLSRVSSVFPLCQNTIYKRRLSHKMKALHTKHQSKCLARVNMGIRTHSLMIY